MAGLSFCSFHGVPGRLDDWPVCDWGGLRQAKLCLANNSALEKAELRAPISNHTARGGCREVFHCSMFRSTIYNWTMQASGNPLLGRVMALDVGSRRIGVAVTDPLGITAQGLDTIQRQNKRRDYEALRRVLEKYEVREIVIGLPLRLSGAEGTQSEKMRLFADDLHTHFGLPVHLWDERWTSTQANRLLRETDLSIKKRGQAVDRMAAILILQSWMEAQGSGSRV
jgi:putative holliday junction resolvase